MNTEELLLRLIRDLMESNESLSLAIELMGDGHELAPSQRAHALVLCHNTRERARKVLSEAGWEVAK